MKGYEYRKLNPVALGAIILELGLLVAIGFTLVGFLLRGIIAIKHLHIMLFYPIINKRLAM